MKFLLAIQLHSTQTKQCFSTLLAVILRLFMKDGSHVWINMNVTKLNGSK